MTMRGGDRRVSTTTKLPVNGYQGPVPDWPLSQRPSAAARAAWEALWRTPQAAQWIGQGSGVARVVAQYAVLESRVLSPKGSGAQAAELRQAGDRLGLNPSAMARLRWEVDVDEPDLHVQTRRSPARARGLKAVDPATP